MLDRGRQFLEQWVTMTKECNIRTSQACWVDQAEGISVVSTWHVSDQWGVSGLKLKLPVVMVRVGRWRSQYRLFYRRPWLAWVIQRLVFQRHTSSCHEFYIYSFLFLNLGSSWRCRAGYPEHYTLWRARSCFPSFWANSSIQQPGWESCSQQEPTWLAAAAGWLLLGCSWLWSSKCWLLLPQTTVSSLKIWGSFC